MALTATTIAGPLDAYSNTVQVVSATGFLVGQPLRIDNEILKVQSINGVLIGVMRGIEGSKALAHNAGANAVTGPWVDFPMEVSPYADSYTYSVDGALTIAPGIHKIIKGSAIALTLAAPTTAQSGIQMTIAALTTFAHTVTYTAGFAGNTTSSDVATLNATGDTFTIVAVNGTWVVVGLNSVTFG